jgi:hypothetical protein
MNSWAIKAGSFMDTYKEALFSSIVSQFLAQHCELSPGKSAQGRVLFRRFRDYWNEVTHGARHPALLGQFRVELTVQGFASSGGKWPRWYDLTLRKKKAVKAIKQTSQQDQSIMSSRGEHAHTATPQTYSLAHC